MLGVCVLGVVVACAWFAVSIRLGVPGGWMLLLALVVLGLGCALPLSVVARGRSMREVRPGPRIAGRHRTPWQAG